MRTRILRTKDKSNDIVDEKLHEMYVFFIDATWDSSSSEYIFYFYFLIRVTLMVSTVAIATATC